MFVDQNDESAVLHRALLSGFIVHSLLVAPFGVDDEFVFSEELTCHLNGSFEISATIILQVQNEVLHPFGAKGIDWNYEEVGSEDYKNLEAALDEQVRKQVK